MAKKKEENVALQVEEDAMTMKEVLEAQDKVKIKIQKLKDREDTFIPVTINGYRMDVPVNKSVEVPEQIAELLENAGYI